LVNHADFTNGVQLVDNPEAIQKVLEEEQGLEEMPGNPELGTLFVGFAADENSL